MKLSESYKNRIKKLAGLNENLSIDNYFTLYHGGNNLIDKINVEFSADEGYNKEYGYGFYATSSEQRAKNYGDKISIIKVSKNADFLNWDNPTTTNQLTKINNLYKSRFGYDFYQSKNPISGGAMYNTLARELGSDKKASNFLRDADIDGARFLEREYVGAPAFVLYSEKNIIQ